MSDNVMYMREEKMSASEDDNQEDVWDDTLLIKAYERAVNSAKEKVASKMNLENGDDPESDKLFLVAAKPKGKKFKKQTGKVTPFTTGMFCRAVYSEDGLEYEAVIKSTNSKTETCQVKYLGYNNEEEIPINSLLRSHGPKAREAQLKQCESSQDFNDSVEQGKNTERHWQFRDQGMIPPPPPPHIMAHFPRDESDALSAMLMAWYMSGYHTGYYQGLTKARSN